ncbi:DUF1854 domain-containing protein [Accumulibacter sp.]|uniref:cyanophycin metabolism-associated DUF1854 family protein n=1 Tax=Accumulibacter sp. TaxID=2053492 RepID=UPI0025E56A61|nr:DUF1854 domain-containing protein [Accumulibacter sp.]MCM8613465.1 DUF1854 domain-containing protein [Accumulibacter sp.]MCM8637102.1 DUF1854 domain-containing protein [Accumulibacter sp.]MCM8640853.1 DUF1854 domain-containing protein [Accumulibacter sp.]
MKPRPDYQLQRNAFGRLELRTADGQIHEGVAPVRAFPITAPDDGLALVDPYGHELAWIDRLDELPDDQRQLLADELAGREFMPVIERIVGVGSFATPSTWEVETDRGRTSFVLKGEEDIRRLASPALLIADSHGIHFLIRDRQALDQHSRRILDRFL